MTSTQRPKVQSRVVAARSTFEQPLQLSAGGLIVIDISDATGCRQFDRRTAASSLSC